MDHLLQLRELQDETGGFVTYIPLAFQPWEAPAMKLPETTGFDDLKAIAVGRLMLDNFPHIKSYWIMIGAAAGAGRPLVRRRRHRRHGDRGEDRARRRRHDAQRMTVHELVRLIREAGRRPIERDTVFNVVKERSPRAGGTRAPAGRRLVPERASRWSSDSRATPRFELERDLPSRVAERLHAGRARPGHDPVDRVRRRATTRSCPAWPSPAAAPCARCASATAVPLAHVRRVALDTSSRDQRGAARRCCCASASAATPNTCRAAPDLDACWPRRTRRC